MGYRTQNVKQHKETEGYEVYRSPTKSLAERRPPKWKDRHTQHVQRDIQVDDSGWCVHFLGYLRKRGYHENLLARANE